MEKVSFTKKVYSVCQMVPSGKVTTYGAIAQMLGIKGYRAIGQALRCNPNAPIVPCHRVVRSDGSLGGFKGSLNKKVVLAKKRLLEQEGVVFKDEMIDLEIYFFDLSIKKNISVEKNI